MDRTATRFALWVLLGSILLQAAWVLALPPFRGIDEFDHAYRAAAVADGQWLPSGDPSPRGDFLVVSARMVEDAGPVCRTLGYVGPFNCTPARTLSDNRVVVASTASPYNPVFYWVVGTAAQPLEGAGALTVMRATNALLCSLALAVAAYVTARWSRTIWPRLGVLAALTPVTVYSGAVAAPNALEAVAALGLWTTLIGLRRAAEGDHGPFLIVAGAFSVPLAGLRGLGPLWLALVILLAALWLGPRLVARLARKNTTAAVCASVLVLAATAASTWWTFMAETLDPGDDPGEGGAWVGTMAKVPLWLLQAIAAFPLRNEQAPSVVYATGVLVMGALLLLGLARGGRQDRCAILVVLLLAVAVPFALQVRIYDTAGAIWQGRYAWPLSMGVLLLAAAAAEERPPRHRLVDASVVCGAGLWLIAHTVSVTDVLLGELRDSPLAGDGRWLTAPPWLVALLAALGVVAWGVGALWPQAAQSRPDRQGPPHEPLFPASSKLDPIARKVQSLPEVEVPAGAVAGVPGQHREPPPEGGSEMRGCSSSVGEEPFRPGRAGERPSEP